MRRLIKQGVTTGVGSALLAIPWAAGAFSFNLGGIEGQIDTTVSVGSIARMEERDASLVGVANGGISRSVNSDDGNLRYDDGDFVSTVAKVTQDLELTYGDFGVFARYGAFYDFEIMNDATSGGYTGDRLGNGAKRAAGRNTPLFDLFAFGRFDFIGGRDLNVRIGRQVVSWGESTFIQNGINVINPIDVSRFRAPGSELKEALVPVPALLMSTSLTTNLSIEALWILNFDEVRIDPRGTFFSTTDFASLDGDKVFAGFGRRADDNRDPIPLPSAPDAQLWADRDPTQRPDQQHQQYGVSLRYFAEDLNFTEFGLFYLRYHSRLPIAAAIRGGAAGGPMVGPLNLGLSFYVDPTGNTVNGDTRLVVEYPEDINLFGLSFNTTGPGGIALQGEYSYRDNLPVSLASVEVLLAAIGFENQAGIPGGLPAGTFIEGFDRVKAHQVQMTATKAMGPQPMVGASQWVLLGEAGYNFLELDRSLLYAGPGVDLPSCRNLANPLPATVLSNGDCATTGYASRSSWGYRVVTALTYDNVIGAVGMSPRLAFSHDVNGTGPNFTDGVKGLSFGLGFNYLQAWQGDISYTRFYGGRTFSGTTNPADPAFGGDFYASSSNAAKDRDFISANVSYAF